MSEFRLYRSLEQTEDEFGPSALTIGNFDGVHAGHREILRRVVRIAAQQGWKPSAMTFDPHPTKVVAPERAPRLLSTPEERAALMREAGIQQVLILPFTVELSRMSPEEFVGSVVVARLGAKAVLVGDNFRFGHKHAGDTQLLEQLGRKYGFIVETVRALSTRGRVISSSEIRNLIEAGQVSLACRLLGRPYAVDGDIVSGHGVGSKKTVPTLNLATKVEVLPATGVYVTRTHSMDAPGRDWPSVTNVGHRPTFGGGALSIETFLLEAPGGEPPARIRLEFLRRLREERKFPDADALKVQILKDAGRARAWFRRMRTAVPSLSDGKV